MNYFLVWLYHVSVCVCDCIKFDEIFTTRDFNMSVSSIYRLWFQSTTYVCRMSFSGSQYSIPFNACILVAGDNWVKLAPSMYDGLRRTLYFKEFDPLTEGYCMITSTNGDTLLKPSTRDVGE